MGRKARYMTIQERTDARNAQRRERGKDSRYEYSRLLTQTHTYCLISVKQRRSAANRAAYMKRMPPPAFPEDLSHLLEEEMSKPELHETYRRFLDGEDMIVFDTYELERDDFDGLTGLPPYPLVSSMHEDRDIILAAVHGYMVHQYVEDLDADCSTLRQISSAELVENGRARHRAILEQLGSFREHRLEHRKESRMAQLTSTFAHLNYLWAVRRLQYAVDDLRTLRETGMTGLLTQLHERRWRLRQRQNMI